MTKRRLYNLQERARQLQLHAAHIQSTPGIGGLSDPSPETLLPPLPSHGLNDSTLTSPMASQDPTLIALQQHQLMKEIQQQKSLLSANSSDGVAVKAEPIYTSAGLTAGPGSGGLSGIGLQAGSGGLGFSGSTRRCVYGRHGIAIATFVVRGCRVTASNVGSRC